MTVLNEFLFFSFFFIDALNMFLYSLLSFWLEDDTPCFVFEICFFFLYYLGSISSSSVTVFTTPRMSLPTDVSCIPACALSTGNDPRCHSRCLSFCCRFYVVVVIFATSISHRYALSTVQLFAFFFLGFVVSGTSNMP